MKSMEKLREMLCDEIDKVVDQGELTTGSLESVGKLLDAIKDLDEIVMNDHDGGYSQRGYGGHIMYYPSEMYYDGGDMGEHSNRNMRSYRNNRYYYDDGKDHMIEQLRHMMDQTSNEKERQAIQKCIRQMEQA